MHPIVIDFKRGLSMVGLARKYGKTRKQIEATIRRWTRGTQMTIKKDCEQ